MKCCIFFFALSKVYFLSSKQEIKFMTFYMQYHLHCHFHSYYSHKILFRIKTVHILLYTHYSYLMTGHKPDKLTWLRVTCCVGSTGCFIILSTITNIYNKKTKGPTLMEFFTATGKLKVFFLTTRDVRCVHHGWHGTHRYDIQVLATHASTLCLQDAAASRKPDT